MAKAYAQEVQRIPSIGQALKEKWTPEQYREHGYVCATGGIWFHPQRDPPLVVYRSGFMRCKGDLKAYYFKRLVEILVNYEGSTKPFDWHPWAETMLAKACRYAYLGIGGAASSGKSGWAALWALINWWCSPWNTTILIASTDKSMAKNRIWKDVEGFFHVIEIGMQCYKGLSDAQKRMPGTLIPSKDIIVTEINGKRQAGAGISLVAADKKHGNDTSAKMIGLKAPRVALVTGKVAEARMFLILDEMHLLVDSVWKATDNLSKNFEFQCIGLANPSTFFDPFGVMNEPADGWMSITPDSEGWKTKLGWCIRLDGEKSPNILAGRVIYPYLFSQKDIDDAILKYGGTNSPGHWQFNRAWFRSALVELAIYTEADIVYHGGNDLNSPNWGGKAIKLATWDPAFGGGDRSMARMGWLGTTVDGLKVLFWGRYEPLSTSVNPDEDGNKPTLSTQQCEAFKAFCAQHGIFDPKYTAIDVTGGGGSYADRLTEVWGPGTLRINFGHAASDLPASGTSGKTADETYADKMTEIWCVPPELIRTGQLKGVDVEAAKELTMRMIDGQDAKGRLKIESKEMLRKRTGKSPDLAEASLMLVQLARERFGLSSNAKAARPVIPQSFQPKKKEAPKSIRSAPPRAARFGRGQECAFGFRR